MSYLTRCMVSPPTLSPTLAFAPVEAAAGTPSSANTTPCRWEPRRLGPSRRPSGPPRGGWGGSRRARARAARDASRERRLREGAGGQQPSWAMTCDDAGLSLQAPRGGTTHAQRRPWMRRLLQAVVPVAWEATSDLIACLEKAKNFSFFSEVFLVPDKERVRRFSWPPSGPTRKARRA